MSALFDLSNFGYKLACLAVHTLNFLIYEGVCFGAYLFIALAITKHMTNDRDIHKVIDSGAAIALLAFIFLVTLYIGGVFRLISLP